jgi:hypothetical protein
MVSCQRAGTCNTHLDITPVLGDVEHRVAALFFFDTLMVARKDESCTLCSRGKSSQAREANARDDQILQRALVHRATRLCETSPHDSSAIGMNQTHEDKWEEGEGKRKSDPALSQELAGHVFGSSLEQTTYGVGDHRVAGCEITCSSNCIAQEAHPRNEGRLDDSSYHGVVDVAILVRDSWDPRIISQ